MARITGIGGIFLRSADPKRLAEWYAEHLGIKLEHGYTSFEWKDEVPKGTGQTALGFFKKDTDYFGPSGQQAMLNLRVDDLDAFLGKLKAIGVEIVPKQMDESYGKFAWIVDCDGNRIELWQPLVHKEEEKK